MTWRFVSLPFLPLILFVLSFSQCALAGPLTVCTFESCIIKNKLNFINLKLKFNQLNLFLNGIGIEIVGRLEGRIQVDPSLFWKNFVHSFRIL
jgi:hypothetical protein